MRLTIPLLITISPASNNPAGQCRGLAVTIGSLIDTGGVSPPYMDLTGTGGRVCSVTCSEPWISVEVNQTADCIAAVTLPAAIPAAGLAACYELTGPTPKTWIAHCQLEVSGRPTVTRLVYW